MQRAARFASSVSVRLALACRIIRVWVDGVADHCLGLLHAALVADQDLNGGRDGAEIAAILTAVLAQAHQGVTQVRDPFARVQDVVEVAAARNQVTPRCNEHVVVVEDRSQYGGLRGDEGALCVIDPRSCTWPRQQ